MASGSSPENARRNAEWEGVADRVEVQDGDAMEIPFANASFDVVLSSFCIHNIYEEMGRNKAITEIARVLKPGGRVVIIDWDQNLSSSIRDCRPPFAHNVVKNSAIQ